MSVLEELYNGKINPSERYIKNSDECQKLNYLLTQNIKKLTKSLSPEEIAILSRMEDIFSELCYLSEVDGFKYGFKLGAQMMLDATAK